MEATRSRRVAKEGVHVVGWRTQASVLEDSCWLWFAFITVGICTTVDCLSTAECAISMIYERSDFVMVVVVGWV